MQHRLCCIPAMLAILAVSAVQARNIFVLPGDGSTSMVASISPDPFVTGRDIGTVPTAFKVLPSPAATKYYVLSRQSNDSVAVLEGTFPALTVSRRLQVGGAIADGVVTPDGRRLVVVGEAGVGVIDTSNDVTLRYMGAFDAGEKPVDVAASPDSSRIYVLSGTTGLLTAIGLTNYTAAGSVSAPGGATNVTVAPNGLVYVTAPGAIYEYDPYTLAGRASIRVPGTPGELHFTPDGAYAVAANSSSLSSNPALIIDLAARTVSNASSTETTAVRFTDVAVTDNRTAYGITQQGQLYTITIATGGSFSYAQTSLPSGSIPQGLTNIEATGELPRPRYLLLSDASGVYRVELQNSQISGPIAIQPTQTFVTATPPATGAPAGSLIYNASQTVRAGGVSVPLVVRVYNAAGLPVSGVPVVFSSSTAGVTLSSASVSTGIAGFASTTVSVPSNVTTGSSIPVTATIQGAQPAQFTLTVGNPNLPGIGGLNAATRPGLQIVGGQGQAVWPNFPTEQPLRIRLNDAQGNPVANAAITWRVTRGPGSVNSQQPNTDSNGEAIANFIGGPSFSSSPGLPLDQSAVVATVGGQQAEFYLTTVYALDPNSGVGIGGPAVAVAFETTVRTLSVKAGEILPNAIVATVTTANSSVRVPNIAMRVVNPSGADPNTVPYVECRDTWALSDNEGRLVCDLIAGPRTGTTQVEVRVAETRSETFTITVGAGSPATIVILQGGSQTGTPGQPSQRMVIEVRDSGGNPLPDLDVTWQAPAGVEFISRQTKTDINGRVDAQIRIPVGQTGNIPITVRAGSATAQLNIAISGPSTGGLAIVSGSGQTAAISTQFAEPLTVRATSAAGAPLANVPVTFAVTSGTATLGSATAQTNAEGIASTTVTAGATAGAVVITATSGTFTQTFNLTIRPPGPQFTAAGILNAAGFQPGVSPGSIAWIRVTGLVPSLRGSVTANPVVGPLPTRLSDVEVLFNNVLAPIYSVSNVNGEESVAVQVPFETNAGPVSVTIRTAGTPGTTIEGVQVTRVKPGVFTFRDTNGQTYAVATRPDGSYITSANPAQRGEQIRVYATGLGQTMPATATNRAGTGGQMVAAPVIAGINNAGTRVISSELLAGSIGVYVVTMEIPADTAQGTNQPLGLAVNDENNAPVFANSAYIPIQ